MPPCTAGAMGCACNDDGSCVPGLLCDPGTQNCQVNACACDVTNGCDTSCLCDPDCGGGGVNRTICTMGTATACTGADQMWDGMQCCVAGVSACVDGSEATCMGAGMHWSGALCCT